MRSAFVIASVTLLFFAAAPPPAQAGPETLALCPVGETAAGDASDAAWEDVIAADETISEEVPGVSPARQEASELASDHLDDATHDALFKSDQVSNDEGPLEMGQRETARAACVGVLGAKAMATSGRDDRLYFQHGSDTRARCFLYTGGLLRCEGAGAARYNEGTNDRTSGDVVQVALSGNVRCLLLASGNVECD